MPKHEDKTCPRCRGSFECKSGDITQCQCWGIRLTPEEREHVEQRFDDCLCRRCLLELKNRNTFFREKFLGNGSC